MNLFSKLRRLAQKIKDNSLLSCPIGLNAPRRWIFLNFLETAKSQADAVLKTEQGQRQDRLKNAIEHLGHKSDSVRLGGAYELFHLAKDTLDEEKKEKSGPDSARHSLCPYPPDDE